MLSELLTNLANVLGHQLVGFPMAKVLFRRQLCFLFCKHLQQGLRFLVNGQHEVMDQMVSTSNILPG